MYSKWGVFGAVALGLAALSPLRAFALTCGNAASGGVFIDVTVPSGSASCFQSGTGTVLGTASDPLLSEILDTTKSGDNRSPSLTLAFSPPVLPGFSNTDGNFSFATAGFHAFYVGFQLNDKGIFGQPGDIENPDWFIVGLADPAAGSGTFDADVLFGLLPSDSIKYAVLYGLQGPAGGPSTTPIPGALWLFGSVVAGAAGYRRLNKKNKRISVPLPA